MKHTDDMKKAKDFINRTDDKHLIHQEMPDGYMEATTFSILPGIYLVFNDIHTQSIPINEFSKSREFLIINYCIAGRCEFRIDENNYSYLNPGMMNISAKMVDEQFYYPSLCYKGFEIYVLPNYFTEQTIYTLRLFHIDIKNCISHYAKEAVFYVPDSILPLWDAIEKHCTADNIGQLRLLVLQILKHIWDTRPANMPHILYLTKVQTSLAKKLHDMLMQDLSQHISIHSISQTLRVSETSLKRYFFCVYGMNVSSYMNEMRMKYAAELLAKSNQNISDIAKACGYVNQGRFACIFRKFYGVKPLDYRRNSKLQEISPSNKASSVSDNIK